MPKSRLRGGAKAHRQRVQKRNNKLKEDFMMVQHLQKKIFEEAKARYEQEQSGKTEQDTWNIS